MRAFVEGSGCSLNKSDTEQIRGFLAGHGFQLVKEPERAGLLVLNACAVKEQTEAKMLKRARQLNEVAERNGGRLVVFGCLPKINGKAISEISEKIVQLGPDLGELARFLQLPSQGFSPALREQRESSTISIIPIARGCLGNCAFCTVRNARGGLKSYSVAELGRKFRDAVKDSKEVWLTAQDCGCYGFDLGTSLPELLKALLKAEGDFRVRIGMLNPGHLLKFLPAYLELFEDKRLYRFFHLPVQSGSNAVLREMNRPYLREQFLEIAGAIRERFPDASIATDVIVGFPGETEKQFKETVSLIEELQPDVVNISRFGARPNTRAALLPGQLHGRVKKERSRILTRLCSELGLERNKSFVGTRQLVLVDEPGPKGNFVARAQNYKPVVVKRGKLGSFADVQITGAFPSYLFGK